MKVLDIYPDRSWSLQAGDAAEIDQLRQAISAGICESSCSAASVASTQAQGPRVFQFVGNPKSLDLAENFFDEIWLNYIPEDGARPVVEQRIRKWLKQSGTAHFPQEPAEKPASTRTRKTQSHRGMTGLLNLFRQRPRPAHA
jgi:hypothetical protein